MPGYLLDGVQHPIVRNAFLTDSVYQLPAQTLVPVCIFECSHKLDVAVFKVQDKGFEKYLFQTFFFSPA